MEGKVVCEIVADALTLALNPVHLAKLLNVVDVATLALNQVQFVNLLNGADAPTLHSDRIVELLNALLRT